MARNALSKAWNLWSFTTSVWPWLIAVLGASAVTAGIAYVQQNLAWAIFLAAGVFCFGTIGVAVFREYVRTQNAANKLIVSNVEVTQRGGGDAPGFAWFRPSITFRNLAPYELHFEVVEFECRFRGVGSMMDKTERLNGIVPQNDTSSLSFPAFQSLLPDMYDGRLLVKAKFGRSRETLSETLQTTLRVSCLPITNPEYVGAIETLRNTLRLEHASED